MSTVAVSGCGCLPVDRAGCYCDACRSGAPCPIDAEQIELCRMWLRRFARPRKTINTRRGSYGLKHDVERWTATLGRRWEQTDRRGRVWTDSRHYIGNGAFVAAAQAEGYRVHVTGINARFNMSLRGIQ